MTVASDQVDLFQSADEALDSFERCLGNYDEGMQSWARGVGTSLQAADDIEGELEARLERMERETADVEESRAELDRLRDESEAQLGAAAERAAALEQREAAHDEACKSAEARLEKERQALDRKNAAYVRAFTQ